MAKFIKDVTFGWTAQSNDSHLIGYNLALTPSSVNDPTTDQANVEKYALRIETVKKIGTTPPNSHVMKDVIFDVGSSYRGWIQTVHIGGVSAWGVYASDFTPGSSSTNRIEFESTATARINGLKLVVNGSGDIEIESGDGAGLELLSSHITESSAKKFVSDTEKTDWNNKVAPSDIMSDGKLLTSILPDLAINQTFEVNSEAAQLALSAQEGDCAIRTDIGRTYIKTNGTAGTMADWRELTAAGEVSPSDVLSAKNEAISTAATDATTKANNAKSGAEATAAADATSKANAAEAAAISAAASDATSKANTAESNAISTAAADATTKADAAKDWADNPARHSPTAPTGITVT